jgi:endonuclease YncB( thermonuclease family)
MKTVQRVALFCLLSILCASPAPGQSVAPIDDPCGDPVVESFSCPLLRGKVVKVWDGDTLTLELANRRRLRVHLIGIAAPELRQQYGRVSQRLLSSLVSGRVVEVCVNTSQYLLLLRSKMKEVTGVVQVRELGMLDVNLLMIQAGLARHAEAKPYTMSNHADCHYVRAEEEARAARRGIW